MEDERNEFLKATEIETRIDHYLGGQMMNREQLQEVQNNLILETEKCLKDRP
jgi:hypothetical protein